MQEVGYGHVECPQGAHKGTVVVRGKHLRDGRSLRLISHNV